ncbi:hypothetical protein B1H10_01480 [candidate division KSB1 bacterium 4484_188]|nr:MAG: hypothetical protein B1H10_01480 [candidate division KSB1 bacterium 4484_188]
MKSKCTFFFVIGLLFIAIPGWAQWQAPVNVGAGVNTPVADNTPCLNFAGDTLYIASFRSGGQGSADIWMTVLQSGVWQPVTNFGTPINSSGLEISPGISADSKTLFFCSTRSGGTGGLDIWVSYKSGGIWSTPVAVSEVNTTDSDMHPFISADGQKLYFSSNRSGGPGNHDIYVSHWSGSVWGTPQLIPGNVNTASDEAHPSLTADGQTMYFSSNRSGGIGGTDIYVSHWTGSEWDSPVNLGGVVNSGETDQFPAISGDGTKLIFVSRRTGGYGNFDIWESVYNPTNNLWGIVSLRNNPPDLSGTIVAIGNLIDTTDALGHYSLNAVPQDSVTLIAFHPGYSPFDTLLINAGGEFNIMLFTGSNPTSFFDDFESGIGNWFGYWALTDQSSYSSSHSLTDSPGSNYIPNQNIWQSMVQAVDLSGFLSAEVTYWIKYELEPSFDYAYLEASTDSGATWINIRTFNGIQTQWIPDTVDVGAFAGQPDVLFRFRLQSDAGTEMDGLYIDDFKIEGGYNDNTPPLILHNPDPDTVSWLSDKIIFAEITDISGVQGASLFYWVDNDTLAIEMLPDSVVGNFYYFTLPVQEAGTWVDYYFHATDNASPANSGNSEIFGHVFGKILYYDDGDPEFFYQLSTNNRVAVHFSIPQTELLASLFFRFYTDPAHPLDTVDVYIWDDLGGYPNQVQLGPVPAYPVNTPNTPHAWSLVDLRPFSLAVGPEFHGGCRFRSSLPVILGDSPALSGRSHVYSASWGDAACDYQLRAVVGQYTPTGISHTQPNNMLHEFTLLSAYPNPFNATCTIPFSLDRQEHISISVYNILGQQVVRLFDGIKEAGVHQLKWNANNMASGVYFLKMRSMSNQSKHAPVKKIMLLK